jgi:hypothetical protein
LGKLIFWNAIQADDSVNPKLFLNERCLILGEVALQSFNGDDVDRLASMLGRGRQTILNERFSNIPHANVANFGFPKLFGDKCQRR